MTIQGAMNELINLLNADDIPIYYKGVIKKVIETIDDYIDGKDDYVKRRTDRKTENSSEIPNNSTISKMEQVDKDINVRSKEPQTDCSMCEKFWNCQGQCDEMPQIEDEPQTEVDIARAIVHKMIDDSEIAEDAYPNSRQRLHDAVDEYEPQTDCAWK